MIAPGISRSLTLSGSVVVAAGEMVPPSSADAVRMTSLSLPVLTPPAPLLLIPVPGAAKEAWACADSERAYRPRMARDPSSRIRRPCERVSGPEPEPEPACPAVRLLWGTTKPGELAGEDESDDGDEVPEEEEKTRACLPQPCLRPLRPWPAPPPLLLSPDRDRDRSACACDGRVGVLLWLGTSQKGENPCWCGLGAGGSCIQSGDMVASQPRRRDAGGIADGEAGSGERMSSYSNSVSALALRAAFWKYASAASLASLSSFSSSSSSEAAPSCPNAMMHSLQSSPSQLPLPLPPALLLRDDSESLLHRLRRPGLSGSARGVLLLLALPVRSKPPSPGSGPAAACGVRRPIIIIIELCDPPHRACSS